MNGLALVAAGGSLHAPEVRGSPAATRRFLGWTTERHWLLVDQG